MQKRSIDESGEPVWVIAPSSAGLRMGPDPRKALRPAAIRAAQTGRTHDRTDECCSNVKKLLPIKRRPHMTHFDRPSFHIKSHRLAMIASPERKRSIRENAMKTNYKGMELCFQDQGMY